MSEFLKIAPAVISLALTYFAHSTIVIGGVWLVSRRITDPAILERMWKWALIVPCLTAITQFACATGVLFDLPTAGPEVSQLVPLLPDELTTSIEPVSIVPANEGPTKFADLPLTLGLPEATTTATASNASAAQPNEPQLRSAMLERESGLTGIMSLAAVLAVVAAALSLRVGILWFRTIGWLRRKTTCESGALHAEVIAIARQHQISGNVNVRRSDTGGPAALGVFRWTIVLPNARLAELSKQERSALITHELAHLVRRDPAWLWIGHTICSILWFQPLNWISVSKIRGLGEIRSDDWSVAHGVGRLQLARCLATVAGWSHIGQPRSVAVAATGSRGKPRISERIERLVESPEKPPAVEWSRGVAALMACATLAAFALLPRIAWGEADDNVPITQSVGDADGVADPSIAPATGSLQQELQAVVSDLEHVQQLLSTDPDPRLHAIAASLAQRLEQLRQTVSNN